MNKDFIGSWNLLSFTMSTKKGWPSFYPLGKKVKGMLIYTAEGTMSVQITKVKRKQFSSDFALFGLGKKGEIADTMRNYVCYCGWYEVDEEKNIITHTIMNHLIPNEEQKEYIRHYKIEENKLVLTTVPMKIGVFSLVGYLVWEKVEQKK